jgi:hypothetical protein
LATASDPARTAGSRAQAATVSAAGRIAAILVDQGIVSRNHGSVMTAVGDAGVATAPALTAEDAVVATVTVAIAIAVAAGVSGTGGLGDIVEARSSAVQPRRSCGPNGFVRRRQRSQRDLLARPTK